MPTNCGSPGRTSRRNLDDVDAVADGERECADAVVAVHQQVAGLLGGPFSSRMARRPQDVEVAVADFQGEEDVDPLQGHGAVDVDEVHGQPGRGLRPQEPSPRRVGRWSGAGGIRRSVRILRIVEAPT